MRTATRRNEARDARHRTVHLVDLENLLGDPWVSGPEVGRAAEQYLAIAEWEQGDLVFVAANPWLAIEFEQSREVDACVRASRGHNGADLALLNLVSDDFLTRRATRVVIGSGDGIFVQRAFAARAHGLDVAVVSRPDSVHGVYRAHGFSVLAFEIDTTPDPGDPLPLAA